MFTGFISSILVSPKVMKFKSRVLHIDSEFTFLVNANACAYILEILFSTLSQDIVEFTSVCFHWILHTTVDITVSLYLHPLILHLLAVHPSTSYPLYSCLHIHLSKFFLIFQDSWINLLKDFS